jgi:hypothetical protein
LLAGYTYFFNPLRLLISLAFPKSKIPFADAENRPAEEIQRYSRWKRFRRRGYRKLRAHLIDAGLQLLGMCGLFHTYRRTLGWAWRLSGGRIQRRTQAPTSRLPLRSVDGGPAAHALPDAPPCEGRQDVVSLEAHGRSPRSDAA